jgi:hypothetical protein
MSEQDPPVRSSVAQLIADISDWCNDVRDDYPIDFIVEIRERLETIEAALVSRAEAGPSHLKAALSDVGIVDDHGTLRWVFRPGQIEVSSSGGDERTRLAGLLRQVRHLVDEQARRIENLQGSADARAEAGPRVPLDFTDTVGAAFDEAVPCEKAQSGSSAGMLWCYWPNSVGGPCSECLRLKRAIDAYAQAAADQPGVSRSTQDQDPT